MWSIREIKQRGINALKANYWPSVGIAFLLSLLLIGSAGTAVNPGNKNVDTEKLKELFQSMTPVELGVFLAMLGSLVSFTVIISFVLKLFVYNPLKVGCYRFFRKNAENPPAPFGVVAEGFGAYWHVFVTLFLKDLFLCFWSMLFLIPGIIKSYSYRMVPYIIKDNPELSATEVITKSRKMMNGHKWKAFVFDLSFIGWEILSFFTCGILGLFWVDPYEENARAALYLELKDK